MRMPTSMGERGKWMPPLPRAFVFGMEILPLVDDEWHPVQDKWVVPGRTVLTSDELRALAAAGDTTVLFKLPQGESA